MAVYTVAQIIETLSKNYEADETLVVTWWAKEDLELVTSDIPEDKVQQVWDEVNGTLDEVIDQQLSWINDAWSDAVLEEVSQYLEEN